MQIRVYALIFSSFCFFISYYFGEYYVNGDQSHYIVFYDNISQYSLRDAYWRYYSTLGAREPVYFLLVYFFSPFVSKLFLFSIISFVLSYYVALGLLRNKMNPILLVLLALNYYLLVLFLAAERLKLSMALLAFGLNMRDKKYQVSFIFLSLMSHFQAFLFLTSIYGNHIQRLFTIGNNFFFASKKGWSIMLTLVLFVFSAAYFRDALISKVFDRNTVQGGIDSILKPMFFYILSLIYTKNKRILMFLTYFPLIVMAYYVGDFRITIFCYFIFMYYGVQYKNGLNLGVILSSSYFFVRGIFFLQEVVKYGTSYYGK